MEKKSNLSKDEKAETKAQTQSKYDSHSEEMPQQKEIIDTSSTPDRISYDNTEDYLEKLPLQIEKTQNVSNDGFEEKKPKREWDASFYPKKSTSSSNLK